MIFLDTFIYMRLVNAEINHAKLIFDRIELYVRNGEEIFTYVGKTSKIE